METNKTPQTRVHLHEVVSDIVEREDDFNFRTLADVRRAVEDHEINLDEHMHYEATVRIARAIYMTFTRSDY